MQFTGQIFFFFFGQKNASLDAIENICVLQDLEGKIVVDELKPEVITPNQSRVEAPVCTCMAWSADGQTLFAGYTDNIIRVWQVSMAARQS